MKKNQPWHAAALAAFVAAAMTACDSPDYKHANEVKEDTHTTEAHAAHDERAADVSPDVSGNDMAALTGDSVTRSNAILEAGENLPATGKPNAAKKGMKGKARSDWGSAAASTATPAGSGDAGKTPSPATAAMDADGYYLVTDEAPEFPGGKRSVQDFMDNNIQYPQPAMDEGVEGTVRLSLAIDENGNVTRIRQTGAPVGYGLEQEAIRVIRKMPKWKPAKVKGKAVKTRVTLPIVFELS